MTAVRTAVVFAGGRGTRMAATHPDRPKPLVEVCGLPLLEMILRKLIGAGVPDIRVALRHRADEIRLAVESFRGIPKNRISFLVESEPLGTIGALALLEDVEGGVLTTNGDLLTGIDYVELLRRHEASAADLTIATHEEFHRLRFGEVVADEDGRVQEYREKPVKSWRISSGVYVFEPRARALVSAAAWTPFPEIVNRAITAGLAVREYRHEEPWADVNDAADLRAAEEMLRRDPAAFGAESARLR